MRPFFLAALNCFVGDEPRVPAATQIFSPSMRPTRDVALILIRNAKRQPVQFDATGLREMKNIFVAIIEKSRGIDRLEMTKRVNCLRRFPVPRRSSLEPGEDERRVARRATAINDRRSRWI